MRRTVTLSSSTTFVMLACSACAPQFPVCLPTVSGPQVKTVASEDRPKVAVLPLDDDELFRAERTDLRRTLAAQLTKIAPDYSILPLAEVDTKLRPISTVTGSRCAFAGEPGERRAKKQGWLATDLMHVSGIENSPEELWIRFLEDRRDEVVTFAARWDRKIGLFDRYRTAFAGLVRKTDGGALLGGLGITDSDKGSIKEGSISLCETKPFGQCDSNSLSWKDKVGELSACFVGDDDTSTQLLVSADNGAIRCEIAGLDSLEGAPGQREACLCRAMGASVGMSAKPGRRRIRVRYEAADLVGRGRPELRVVEVSTNLDSATDWHSIRTERDGKVSQSSVERLVVDNLDAIAAPLARCPGPVGSVVVAELEVREDGVVGQARVLSSGIKTEYATCVEKALGRGAFLCTGDGKKATLRIAVEWPDQAK